MLGFTMCEAAGWVQKGHRTNSTSVSSLRKQKPKLETMAGRIVAHMQRGGEEFRAVNTRAEIARDLGISTSTMSGRVRQLLDEGRLIERSTRFQCSVTGNKVRGVSVP